MYVDITGGSIYSLEDKFFTIWLLFTVQKFCWIKFCWMLTLDKNILPVKFLQLTVHWCIAYSKQNIVPLTFLNKSPNIWLTNNLKIRYKINWNSNSRAAGLMVEPVPGDSHCSCGIVYTTCYTVTLTCYWVPHSVKI